MCMRKTTADLQTPSEREQGIEQICLRLLARREHSRRELLNKLALRGFGRDEVEPVIEAIAASNWQNDQRYAECLVRQRLEKGHGPLRIRYELRQAGIDEVDLDRLAEEYAGGWQSLLRDVYRNKYGEQPVLTQAEWLKRSRFLQQRGFSAEMAKALYVELKIKIRGVSRYLS